MAENIDVDENFATPIPLAELEMMMTPEIKKAKEFNDTQRSMLRKNLRMNS